MYARMLLMNGTNKEEMIKDCTKIYEKVREWETKIEKKYPFDQNDNVWRSTVKSQLSQFVSLSSIGKKERNVTDPTKCSVCHARGVKISRCGRCRKVWYVELYWTYSQLTCGSIRYCGVECQRADWPTHKPECK